MSLYESFHEATCPHCQRRVRFTVGTGPDLSVDEVGTLLYNTDLRHTNRELWQKLKDSRDSAPTLFPRYR